MNERILELAEQADIHFYQGRIPETGFEYEGAEVTVEDLKKFAKLIAQECMNQIAEYNCNLQYDDWDEGYCCGVDAAISVIKQHFGIEQ